VESSVHGNVPEFEEFLLMKRILLKPHKEIKEPTQRKTLFRTIYKSKVNCCNIIIDNGSTKNFVSRERDDKLSLRNTIIFFPYKVSWLQNGH